MDSNYTPFKDPFDDPGPGPPQHRATARDWRNGVDAECIQRLQQYHDFIQQLPYPANPAYLSSGVTQPDYNNIYSPYPQAPSGPMYPPRSSSVSYSLANSPPPNVTFPVDLSQAPPPVYYGLSNTTLTPNSHVSSSGRNSSQSPENSNYPLFSIPTPPTSSASSLGTVQPGHDHIYLNRQNESNTPIYPFRSPPVLQSLASSLPSVPFSSSPLPPSPSSRAELNTRPTPGHQMQLYEGYVVGPLPERVHRRHSMNRAHGPKAYYHPYAAVAGNFLDHHDNSQYQDVQAPSDTRPAVHNPPGPPTPMVSDITPTSFNPLSWFYSQGHAPYASIVAATWSGTDMTSSSVDHSYTRGSVSQMGSPIIDRDQYQEFSGLNSSSTQSQLPTLPLDQSLTQIVRPGLNTPTLVMSEAPPSIESCNSSGVDPNSPRADESWTSTSSSVTRIRFDPGGSSHNLHSSTLTLDIDGQLRTEPLRSRGGRRKKRESSLPREDFPPIARPFHNLQSRGPPLHKQVWESMVVKNNGRMQCMFCGWLLPLNQKDKIPSHFSAHLGHFPHQCLHCRKYYIRPEDHGAQDHNFEDAHSGSKRAARKPRPR